MRGMPVLHTLVALFVLAAICAAGDGDTSGKYVIGYGDTLWDLSVLFYGTHEYWEDILRANPQISSTGSLQPGQEITIPYISGVSSSSTDAVIEEYSIAQVEVPTRAANVPLLSRLRIETAGWVEPNPLSAMGTVLLVDVEEQEGISRDRGFMGDLVELDIGANEGAQVGNVYRIIKEGEEVRHPDTGTYLGRVMRIAAICRVLDTTPSTCVAKLEHGYLPVVSGDMVLAYEPAGDISINPQPTTDGMTAWVIGLKNHDRDFAFCYDIVYIDKGSEDGLSPGDMFQGYKYGTAERAASGEVFETADIPIVEMVVLDTERSSSAAIVSLNVSTDLVEVGDRIHLVRQQP